ncbi:MAG: AAA family ATPase [Crocinitomicaceae bacterium]|nr:AAA family ATPase [Crocinitomicaceae bacterium]
MSQLVADIRDNLGYEPNEGQTLFLEKLDDLVKRKYKKDALILSGYAGTGKTSLISAFVKSVGKHGFRTQLLAPTGRAAKVIGNYSKKKAHTIHRVIYQRKVMKNGAVAFELAFNPNNHTIFIVDEASMIADYSMPSGSNPWANRNLLEDLVEFIFSGTNNKLILVGDEGQLPPVGADFSPALNKEYLENTLYNIEIFDHRLTEVSRQAADSGILKNATQIRNIQSYEDLILETNTTDFIDLNGQELQDALEESHRQVGVEETLVITRSNKRANSYNNHIRSRVFYHEDELSAGDILMAVKNNYSWLPENSEPGFIANGEMMQVNKILGRKEMYGFQFADARVKLVDYPNMDEIEVKLLVDTLHSESPNLSREDQKRLFFEIEKDHLDEKNKTKRFKKIMDDPYFQAIQVKYAYAVTCHKSQGGQWEHVYIDQGYLHPDAKNKEYLRWLYTAVTRAKSKVFLVNFERELLVS